MRQRERNQEPTTEDEANDLKDFLEKGARTDIEEIDTFEGARGVTVALGRPDTIPFRVETPELVQRVDEAEDNQVFLTVSVDRVEGATESLVHVFLNNEDAGPRTLLSDSSYIGSFSFFCHNVDQQSFVCEVGSGERTALRFRFNITSALKATDERAAPRATFVVVPIDGRQPRSATVNVGAAELQLARSVVAR